MKISAMRASVLLALTVASTATMAQAYRVSNQTYGYYYADTSVDLTFNGSQSTFYNQEYYLNSYDYTQGSNAASIPVAAAFNKTGTGNAAFGLSTVNMQGYAYTTWGANHAKLVTSGYDQVNSSVSSTSCPSIGNVCVGPETTTTFNTASQTYGGAYSRWEEIYQTGGSRGALNMTFQVHATLGAQTPGPTSQLNGTNSGSAQFYWAERDFNGTSLGQVSAYYDAGTDTWSMQTFSNVSGLWIDTNGTGALTIDQSIKVHRSFVTGEAVYVDSYLQTYVNGNGISDAENTVTMTSLDAPTGTRLLASSGANYLGVLSFGGGGGSGTVCADVSCLAGGGGGGGGIPVGPVPEPETYALMLAGLGALGLLARRRRAARGG